jgi:hypothetical protein
MMDNVRNCVDLPSSLTYRSHSTDVLGFLTKVQGLSSVPIANVRPHDQLCLF